jgi:hypothetical protein
MAMAATLAAAGLARKRLPAGWGAALVLCDLLPHARLVSVGYQPQVLAAEPGGLAGGHLSKRYGVQGSAVVAG